MIEPIQAKPNPRRNDKVALFFLGPFLASIIRQFLEGAMKAEVEGHAHSVAAGQPSVRAPSRQQEHA